MCLRLVCKGIEAHNLSYLALIDMKSSHTAFKNIKGANHSKPITCKKFQMSLNDHEIFRMASWYIEVYESGIDFSLSLLDFVQHGN